MDLQQHRPQILCYLLYEKYYENISQYLFISNVIEIVTHVLNSNVLRPKGLIIIISKFPIFGVRDLTRLLSVTAVAAPV